jgi:hypothetical protein
VLYLLPETSVTQVGVVKQRLIAARQALGCVVSGSETGGRMVPASAFERACQDTVAPLGMA